MTSPVDQYIINGVPVDKAAFRADDRTSKRRNISNASTVRNLDLSGQYAGIYLQATHRSYDFYAGGETPIDDMTDESPYIQDAAGNIFAMVSTISPPLADVLGGVFASDAIATEFLIGLDSAGNLLRAQPSSTDLSDGANLTQIAALVDPEFDRLLFWDESAGKFRFLELGTNLSITDNVLNASGGGGGGGVDDATRQDLLLTTAYQSKSFVAYRRLVNLFADGYKASDGINSGASSGYTLETGNGLWRPTIVAGVRITGATPTAPLGGTAANLNDNNSATTSAASIGNLTGLPVTSRILAKLDLGSAQSVSKIEAIQMRESAGSLTFGLYYSLDDSAYTQLGADFTLTTSPTDYSRTGSVTARYVAVVLEANAWGVTITMGDLNAYGAPTYANATVVTTAQTTDSAVSNARVLLEIDNIGNPTLNTDLTVEVTCNGGTNWTAATLYAVSFYGQGGRRVLETADTACTSGTSFAARIKTLNGKNVPVHALALQSH